VKNIELYIYTGKIGEVTSGSFSPASKNGSAMGYVNPQNAIPGINCMIEIDGKKTEATLSVMPLYDPADLRTKGK
jgi:glycine cleavage system aminomethyltransferase T